MTSVNRALVRSGRSLHQLICINAEVADVITEGTQTDFGILVKITFAKLKETTERFKDLEVPIDSLSSEGNSIQRQPPFRPFA